MIGHEYITTLQIPPQIANHRFVKQVVRHLKNQKKNDTGENFVIGTYNLKKVEMYGWRDSVPLHVDNQGIGYFLVLSACDGIFYDNDCNHIDYKQGALIRMNDFEQHGVFHHGIAVCLFLGTFKEPCDDYAVEQFREALQKLCEPFPAGYYSAPRCHSLEPETDECYSFNSGEPKIKLLADTPSEHVITCSTDNCTRPASQLDHHFPYYWDGNTCAIHSNDN